VRLTLDHRTLGGVHTVLVVDVDADGAIMFWRSEDPITGAHVKLDGAESWWAVRTMHRATERIVRGAA
jgi:hypothetical protein